MSKWQKEQVNSVEEIDFTKKIVYLSTTFINREGFEECWYWYAKSNTVMQDYYKVGWGWVKEEWHNDDNPESVASWLWRVANAPIKVTYEVDDEELLDEKS